MYPQPLKYFLAYRRDNGPSDSLKETLEESQLEGAEVDAEPNCRHVLFEVTLTRPKDLDCAVGYTSLEPRGNINLQASLRGNPLTDENA